jgi:peptide/nickel transport system substrate-binding protein
MRRKSGIAKLSGSLLMLLLLCCRSSEPQINRTSSSRATRCSPSSDDFLTMRGEIGRFGDTLVISERAEPKTLNPLVAADQSSQEIIGLLTADLVHINRYTQQTEPALATSWSVSADGRRYILHLRCNLQFSDGSPFNADDVVFSFRSYLDERFHSIQRDLLIIGGQPISVEKIDDHTVDFTLAQPYAAAERLFDSMAILPRHILQANYEKGTLATVWSVNSRPKEIAGLGPFRLKEYIPGQRIVLERNPYYWKKDLNGNKLPYLDSIVSVFVPNADAEAMRFEAGQTDIIAGLNAADYDVLKQDQKEHHFGLYNLGPGLEYDFLFFNQNIFFGSSESLEREQDWFRQTAFRQAISNAIDRAGIARLAYRGRAYPLSVPVTPGNKLWIDNQIPAPARSLEKARRLLRECGFSWTKDGSLRDRRGLLVRFSIAVNAGKPEQVQMATLIQQDLKELGIDLVPELFEFHTFLNSIFKTFKYESAILALADGDSDPNSELNVLTSHGGTHVWNLQPDPSLPAWQREIDSLMQQQLVTPDYKKRKLLYDRVQELLWENVPMICLVSPDILVGAKDRIGNFRPAILRDYALWNAEQLFIRQSPGVAIR